MHKVIDLFHYPNIILQLAVVGEEAVDLLLDICQLRIAKAGESGNLCDCRVGVSILRRRTRGRADEA